jgi:uncharacterized protein YndB with AHSA1/START domain
MSDIVRVERDIAAPPEDVFDAWIDPQSMRVWMAPEPLAVADVECDVRVGGTYRVVMIDRDGSVEHFGKYLEIDRPHQLVFTWQAAHLGAATTTVRVLLRPIPIGTRMVIEHHDLPDEARSPHRQGWTSIGARLAAKLTG